MQMKWYFASGALVALELASLGAWCANAAERMTNKVTTSDSSVARSDEADRLVRQALVAEAAGNADERADYLRQALAVDPQHSAAHWQSGDVRVGEQWLSADAAASENAWSGKFTTYRQMRDQSPPTADAQIRLARWCATEGLKDQERLHLVSALQLRPTKIQQRDVMNKLGLVRYQKSIMPAAEAEALKKKSKEAETAMQEWKPRLNRLREDLESRDTARQDAAREKLLALKDTAAIAPLEAVFAKAKPEAAKVAVAAIAGMKQQAATDSLVRHAVLAPHEEVRKAAAEALRPRSVFSYVPILLSSMNTPIEISFQAFSYDGGAFGERLQLFREGPLYSISMTSKETALSSAIPTPGQPAVSLTGAAEAVVARRAAADGAIAAAAVQENVRTEQMNSLIASALRTATGNDISEDDAKLWWDWWTEYNEMHYAADKPTYENNRSTFTYYSAALVNPTYAPTSSSPSSGKSAAPSPSHYDKLTVPFWKWTNGPPPPTIACFVPGTKVWTVTGTVPIEKVQIGDWVLSQNVDTGELAYKPVAATTVGPPLPIIETRAGGETIRSTVGHLFWVDGTGWRMAKELKVGDRLHTTGGWLTIESVEKAGEAACHNLIVPDFNTYFVTDQQLLVHDIDIRGPTTATVPGLTEVAP